LCFAFSFYLFFDFFISFAFEFQINSKKILNFSKIQHNHTKQQETRFDDKTKFQQYFICLVNRVLVAYSKIEIGFKNNSLKSIKIIVEIHFQTHF
jgi:hypothetical protein